MAKQDKRGAVEEADEVREMTLEQVRALPGLLGRVAPFRVSAQGFYGFTDSATGRKILIVLKGS